MLEALRRQALRLLKVPPDPRPPAGEAERVRVFRAAPNFYRYNLARWVLAQGGALLGLIVGVVLVRVFAARLGQFFFFDIVVWIEILAWIGFLLQLPFTYALLRLDYDMRWYIVTDRSLRIREGINRMREQTMTFANIQNMSIRQGPLQRLLGIADLEVHTAGGGGSSGGDGSGSQQTGQSMHVGIFRGVDNAAQIRDTIRERVRRFRDAGLGDLDDDHASEAETHVTGSGHLAPAGSGAQLPLLAAARELLAETRRLRESIDVARPGT
jgi:membrane protein YdbS with pleckstrin-like domain